MEKYTLGKLLEELKIETPKLEKGIYIEVLKSMYPDDNVKKDKKNFLFEGNEGEVTIPLACSSKDKKMFKKHNSPFFEFFKDNTRGDFLEILETDGYTAKCINRSIKEDFQEKYYNTEEMKIINISYEDILNGSIKKVYRGIKKHI